MGELDSPRVRIGAAVAVDFPRLARQTDKGIGSTTKTDVLYRQNRRNVKTNFGLRAGARYSIFSFPLGKFPLPEFSLWQI